ncbi:hypothetical protein GXW82_01100 [Streptacidiphilus sp. 4-A2]|nr:hypothetical protein [Streptacidiphilus sp. 4-A2]
MRTATAWLRTLFAASLIVGVYGLACVAVVGELVLVFGPLTIPTADRSQSMDTAISSSVFTFPVVAILVLGALALSRATGSPEDSVQLSPEQAPELWDMVNGLAAQVGTRPPSELRLVSAANAGSARTPGCWAFSWGRDGCTSASRSCSG